MIENPWVVGQYYSERQPGDRLSDYLEFEFCMSAERDVYFTILDGDIVAGRISGHYFEPDQVLEWWVAEYGKRDILDYALQFAQSSDLPKFSDEGPL
jgi:hypothetical protein